MARCITHAFLHFVLPRHHRLRLRWIILRPSRILEQLWLIHEVILNQIICILGGHHVITRLDSRVHPTIVVRAEARIVFQTLITICLFVCGGLVVVAIERGLTRLEIGIGLVPLR